MEPATIESKLERLQPLIKEYVLERLPDGMDADDVIQETMIFCWENPSKCSGSFLNAETCRFINEKIYEMSAPDDYISEALSEDIAYNMDEEFYRLSDFKDICNLLEAYKLSGNDIRLLWDHSQGVSFTDMPQLYGLPSVVMPFYREYGIINCYPMPQILRERYNDIMYYFRTKVCLSRRIRKPPFNGTVYYKIEGRE